MRRFSRILWRWRARRPDLDVVQQQAACDVIAALSACHLAPARERLAELSALAAVKQAMPALVDAVSDSLALAYLDGATDAAAEDSDEMLDERSRSERAASRAAAAIETLAPFLSSIECLEATARDEAGIHWGALAAMYRAVGGDPRMLLVAGVAEHLEAPLNRLASSQPAARIEAVSSALLDLLREQTHTRVRDLRSVSQ